MRTIILFISVLFFFACADSADQQEAERTDGYTRVLKTKEDSLYHDVMEGHDIGMAKMGKLSGALKNVQQKLDSIESLEGRKRAQVADYKSALISLKEELQQAEVGMNLWMEEFVADSAQDNTDIRVKYLASEKVKVEKVRDDILQSLQKADSIFGISK